MKALAQNEIIALIADLNAFADSAESLIDTTQTNYDKDKKLLQNRHSNDLSNLDTKAFHCLHIAWAQIVSIRSHMLCCTS